MKWIKLGTTLCLLLSLTGCWSKVELDEVTFIFGLFVDVGNQPNSVEVTVVSPLPIRFQENSGGGKKYESVSKTARTIPEAVIGIQKELTRRLSFSHIKAVVIGEEYARQGISELLEWVERVPEFPIGTYVMATPTKAKELTKLSPIILRKLDEKISSMLLEAIKMTQKMKTDVFQLGMLLEWNYPEYWNQVRHKWDDYYSNELKIYVGTQFYIDNFGSEE